VSAEGGVPGIERTVFGDRVGPCVERRIELGQELLLRLGADQAQQRLGFPDGALFRTRNEKGTRWYRLPAYDGSHSVPHDVMESDERHENGHLRGFAARLHERLPWIGVLPILVVDFEWQICIDATSG
jgi:hypothetical protein